MNRAGLLAAVFGGIGMENENNYNQRKRRVSRQSWKPGPGISALYAVWKGVYSVLKIALAALVTVLIIACVCALVFVGVLADYLEGDIIPQAGVQLEGFDLNQTSYVYYVDGEGNIQVLQELYSDTESEWASYEEIPEDMIHAAVSIEDHRFFEHQGVDWFTTVKACINMFVGSGDQFGGSSITQQLIKNLLLTENEAADDVTVQRKVLEIFRATEFEKRYDKTVVMEWYLNVIFFGNRCDGVKAAAEKYFGKELEDLNAAECACIISITNNPSLYNPYRTKLDSQGLTGAEQNKIRRTNTLWAMRNYGYLTEEEYQEALVQSEEMQFKDGIDFEYRYSDCLEEGCGYHGWNSTFDLKDGVYYCPQCGAKTAIGEDASEEVYSWFVDAVLEDVARQMAKNAGIEWDEDGKTEEMYMNLIRRGGYHIYSTLDMDVQNAVDAIYKNLDEIPTTSSIQQLQSAIVIIDNETGDIVALSGGVGDNKGHDDFNRATQAKLQPGSSIKPLTVYAPAFELGVITPASVVKDLPYQYNENEKDPEKPIAFPRNSTHDYNYNSTILNAVANSVNAVAVNALAKMVGMDTGFSFAKEKFGLEYLTDRYVNSAGTVFSDVNLSPLALGAPTIGVTVRQMSNAYSTFANNGVYREARTYTKVYNSDGKVVLYNDQESERILSEKAVNYMNYCLEAVVSDYATGGAAAIRGQHVAGKTGSTMSDKDRWFCGFTDYYTAAVWCGYDMPEVINLTGANRRNPACQLFQKVMAPIHAGKKAAPLYDDSEFVQVGICLDSGKLASAACSSDIRGSRITYVQCCAEDVPTQTCDKHTTVSYCSNGVANEYCQHFASVNQVTLQKKALLYLTQAELDELLAAKDSGLKEQYLRDDYVYLVDDNGRDDDFFGFKENINKGLHEPYQVCTKHTKEAWEAYLASQPQEDTEEITQ